MKKTVWKFYMNYEKEEAWLNSMAEKGFAFTNYFLWRYTFTDCEPGEYIYRLEYLKEAPSHPESQKYLSFMAENGVEHISSWNRWVYFRKRAKEGSFDIYSGIDSRITHYKRIGNLWLALIFIEIILSVPQLSTGLEYIFKISDEGRIFNLIVGLLILCLAVLFFYAWNSTRKKVKNLLLEKTLHE
jgi:hypothetical protein